MNVQEINKAWWQVARVAVRATVKNETERDNALALLDKALSVANGILNDASNDRNGNHSATGTCAGCGREQWRDVSHE